MMMGTAGMTRNNDFQSPPPAKAVDVVAITIASATRTRILVKPRFSQGTT